MDDLPAVAAMPAQGRNLPSTLPRLAPSLPVATSKQNSTEAAPDNPRTSLPFHSDHLADSGHECRNRCGCGSRRPAARPAAAGCFQRLCLPRNRGPASGPLSAQRRDGRNHEGTVLLVAESEARSEACSTGAIPMQRHRVACRSLSPARQPPSRSRGRMHQRRARCRQPALPCGPASAWLSARIPATAANAG
jgi:hypothetical protein